MQIITEKTSSNTVSVTVKESAKEMSKWRDRTVSEIGSRVNIKGFRPGSVIPAEVIEREYSAEFIEGQAIEAYLNESYQKIIAKSGVTPVSAGEIKETKSFSPLEVVFEVEVLPEVTMDEKKVAKVKMKRTEVSVSDEDVDNAVKAIEGRFTTYAKKEGESVKIEAGDRVEIDAQGYDKKGGEAIVETQVRGYSLVIGSGQFIPGFEDAIIGHMSDEVIGFPITFPKDYHSDEFKGRKVYFEVTVHSVEAAKGPEWTPEFIEGLRGKKTDMKGLREILSKEILGERERNARAKDEEALLDELLKLVTVDIGPKLLELEIDKLYREQASRLESQNLQMKNYLAHIGQTDESYRAETLRPEAERRLKAELILKHLQADRKTEVADEEVNSEVATLLEDYSNQEVRKRLVEKLVPGDSHYEDMRARLGYKKVVDSFFA
jgi:trigger factor